MASNYVCKSCIRALRRQIVAPIQKPITPSARLFATTSSRLRFSPQQINDETAPHQPNQSPEPHPYKDGAGSETAAYSQRLAESIRSRAQESTETYVAYGGTERLFKECARQADYEIKRDKKGMPIDGGVAEGGEDLGTPIGTGIWYTNFNLPCTFNTWAQITFLHMWLLTTRFRLFPAGHAPSWHQHLMDHFSFDAERRMTEYHALTSGSIRQRYLKDLFIQWRGCLAAYDEGLLKGDAVLAAAVWRNILGGKDLRDGDVQSITEIVEYIRKWLKELDGIQDQAVASGSVLFGGVSNKTRAQ